MMKVVTFLFLGGGLAIAIFLNSALDKRAQKKVHKPRA